MADALEIGGAALQGIGSGLQQSVGNLRQTAMDIRNEPIFEAQKQQAITEGLQAQKMNQKYTKEQIVKQHPGGERYWSLAEQQGIIAPGSTEIRGFDVAKMSENLAKNPQIVQSWITEDHAKAVNDAQRNDTAIATVTNDAKKIQEEISGLAAQNNPANDKKIESLSKKLQDKQGEVMQYTQAKNAAIQKQLSLSEQKDAIGRIVEYQFIQGLGKDDQLRAKQLQERGLPVTAENLQKIKQEDKSGEQGIPSSIREFEIATGTKPETRGTQEYKKSYMDWRKSQKDQAGMQFTPEALKALSTRFAVTGEIPGMGMGKAATEARTKVINQWASDLKKDAQTPEEQLAQQASYKASIGELKRLQGQRGTVMAFARTAEKNLKLANDLSKKVNRTGVPVINRWLLAGKRSIAGDPDVAAFDAALTTGINEYAKVTSSATGGGVTSDAARKEVRDMLNVAQTPEQIQSVMDQVLTKDLANRKSGYDDQIKVIQDAIANRGKEKTTEITTAVSDPIAELKKHAQAGDTKAQSYLKSKGIAWQQ